MNIVNIINQGMISNSWYYKVLMDHIQIIKTSNDRLMNNYTFENMKLDDHLSLDMLVDDNGEMICFSGLFRREPWAKGVYRISNRTYVNPKYRTNSYNFLNPSIIGPHQIEKHKEDIKFAFISRESFKGKYYFRKLKRSVPFYNDWTISNKMMHVVPNGIDKSSYQYIIYKNYTDYEINPIDGITEDEWRELPH
jgi:hypothetical protein